MTAVNTTFRNLVKNSSMMFLLNVAAAGVSVITIPIMLDIMGVERYGHLVLVQAIALGVFTVFTFQYWRGMMVALPGHRMDFLQLRQTVMRSFFFEAIGMGAVVLMMIGLWLWNLPQFQAFSGIELLLLALTAVFPVFGTHTAYFRLVNRYNVLMVAGLTANVLKLVLLALVAKFHPTISSAVLAFALPEVVRFILLFVAIFAWRYGIDGELDGRTINQRTLNEAGRWSTLQAIGDLPVLHLDRIILGFALPGENLGVYAILKRIYSLINMATAPFYSTSIPEFAAKVNAGNVSAAYSLWHRTMNLLFAVTAAAALGCYLLKGLWMKPLFPVLLGYETEFLIVLLSAVVAGGFTTTHSLYWALGKLRETAFITFGTNALYLGLLWLMTWAWGLTGTVAAFLVHVLLAAFIKIHLLSKERPLTS